MAANINEAFRSFLRDSVNLDPEKVKKARASQVWLTDQINNFKDFFPLYSAINIEFGSFARRTKKRPLDDIDLMFGLLACGCTYFESDTIRIQVLDNCEAFKLYKHDNSDWLNSRKIINQFVSKLGGVDQYKSATIKRNQEAATLQLISYEWNFDIVPCFITMEEYDGRTYYLIPDGNGHWKKTDPRIDKEVVETATGRLSESLLDIIRIMKYWNNRPTMPSMGSYLLENIILNYFSIRGSCSAFPDLEIPNLLNHIHSAVYNSVADPKRIQGELNNLDYDTRTKISARAYEDYQKALNARNAESKGNIKVCFDEWRRVFGDEFPEHKES
jgi:hypothetical protein